MHRKFLTLAFNAVIMQMNDLIEIGTIKKARGLDGAVRVQVNEIFEAAFLEAKAVFIQINGQNIPYFISSIEAEEDIYVYFEDVSDKDAAQVITGKKVFLPKSAIEDHTDLSSDALSLMGNLEGFTIIDKDTGVVGVIESVIEMPGQVMAIVFLEEKEVLIPLHDALLVEADPKAKTITMDLPTGLLDL